MRLLRARRNGCFSGVLDAKCVGFGFWFDISGLPFAVIGFLHLKGID